MSSGTFSCHKKKLQIFQLEIPCRSLKHVEYKSVEPSTGVVESWIDVTRESEENSILTFALLIYDIIKVEMGFWEIEIVSDTDRDRLIFRWELFSSFSSESERQRSPLEYSSNGRAADDPSMTTAANNEDERKWEN